ncbi:hypothetical protein [Janibacter terrae]|uniref:hypothetical protein n=1 Tax=Janibacter terrae TaxID=103817 RepID=UPI0031F8ADDF
MSPHACALPEKCGRPQDGPGHPRKGWLNVKVAGIAGSTWWCSPTCLAANLTHGDTLRVDVATCPTCINRHDRAHRCPACGTTPHITAPVVPARRLYQRAHDAITAGEDARA